MVNRGHYVGQTNVVIPSQLELLIRVKNLKQCQGQIQQMIPLKDFLSDSDKINSTLRGFGEMLIGDVCSHV